MSAVKLLAGFIIGLIACAIILALISIRAPITIDNAQGNPVVRTEEAAVAIADAQNNIEQNENKNQEEYTESENSDAEEVSEEEATEETADANEEKPVAEAEIEEAESETIEGETAEDTQAEKEVEVAEEGGSESDAATEEEESPEVEVAEADQPEREDGQSATLPNVTQGNASSISRLQTGQSSLLTDRRSQSSRIRLSGDRDDVPVAPRAEDQAPTALSAFSQNAIEFTPDGRPLLAIVLIDVESDGLSQAELLRLPFKSTIALSVNSSNVTFVQDDYWSSGSEIVSLIPEDQANALIASDGDDDAVRSYLELIYQKMPKTLGVVDFPTANIQKQRRVFLPLLSVLAETGHAFFSYAVGINNTGQEAANLGMPSASIARVLDQNGEDTATVQNYLSNAARAADRQGASIVIGRATQSTVNAIRSWMETSNAASVQLAPLSAATLFQR